MFNENYFYAKNNHSLLPNGVAPKAYLDKVSNEIHTIDSLQKTLDYINSHKSTFLKQDQDAWKKIKSLETTLADLHNEEQELNAKRAQGFKVM